MGNPTPTVDNRAHQPGNRRPTDGATLSRQYHFATTPEWLLYSDASDRAIRLYGILDRHSDKAHRCFPSRSRLGELMHCSLASVDRALDELVDRRAITVQLRSTPKGRTSSEYTLMQAPPTVTGDDLAATDEGSQVVTGAIARLVTHDEARLITGDGAELEPLEREPLEREKTIAPTARKRDVLFESLCEATGLAWRDGLTNVERGRVNKALAELRKVGAEPGEVFRRAENYRRHWPDTTCTPMALAGQWGMCATPPPPARARGRPSVSERNRDAFDAFLGDAGEQGTNRPGALPADGGTESQHQPRDAPGVARDAQPLRLA